MVEIIDGCIGCGVCESVCPDVFEMNAEGLAQVYAEMTDENKDLVIEAKDSCPVEVIIVNGQ